MGPALTRMLTSWWPAVCLLLLHACGYVFFSFGERPFERWTQFLFFSVPGVAQYLLLVFSLVSVSFGLAIRRLRPKRPTAEDIRQMAICREVPASGDSAGDISAWMKKKGFSTHRDGDVIMGSRGRFSFLPGTVMRAGLAVLMVSLLVSAHTRKEEEVSVREGHDGTLFGRDIRLSRIAHDVPAEFLSVGEKGAFALKAVSATLSSAGDTFVATGGFPALSRGIAYRITDIGFSHDLELKTPGEKIRRQTNLDVLPPGKAAIISFPSDMILTFTLQPGKTYQKGLLTGKLYDLKEPVYRVVLQQGMEKKKSEGVLKPGGTLDLENASVSLGSKEYFVRLKAVSDPVLPGLYAGFLLFLTGLIMMCSRFFWYEKRLIALISGESIMIGYQEEFFMKWGIQKFLAWTRELRT